MPKRHDSDKSKYKKIDEAVSSKIQPTISDIALMVPRIVKHFDTSFVKQNQEKPDWKLYKIEIRDGKPFIVREMCDRCGKVKLYPAQRMIRVFSHEEFGDICFESGVCKDCINASTYVDKYLDGDALSEKDAKELFYKYAVEYERAWRMVLAAAPNIAMTEQEWQHRCKFFNGCAMCGGPIEVRAKYFPIYLNGTHTAWNVIPLCKNCLHKHYAGRVTKGKEVRRYRIFSTLGFFNKSKTIRLYLLHEMEKHSIYIEPLIEFRKRFYEAKILEGSD